MPQKLLICLTQGYDGDATGIDWSNEIYGGEFILKITTAKGDILCNIVFLYIRS